MKVESGKEKCAPVLAFVGKYINTVVRQPEVEQVQTEYTERPSISSRSRAMIWRSSTAGRPEHE